MLTLTPTAPAVTISGKPYSYTRRWSGQRLLPADGYLAFDTETDVVALKEQIPRLAMASASAGEEHNCVIHPDDVGSFILAHKARHFIFHHVASDFWVVQRHLSERGEKQALQVWWAIADANRLHDLMLLDILVRLAREDSYPAPRDLAALARQYAGLEINKDVPYRTRYGEIIGQDWASVEEGFFEYGVKDAIVTKQAYRALRKQALGLVEEFGHSSIDVLADARQNFGLLTETVQVKKAIALAQISRNGMRLDQEWLRQAEAELRSRLDEAVAQVRSFCPTLYKTDEEGQLIYTAKAKAPSINRDVLRAQLQQIATELNAETGLELSIPRTKKSGELSTTRKFWQEYQLLQFFHHLRDETVHPSYAVMVRTGRTSCSGPNVQQIPRDSTFRQTFVASPGFFLLTLDCSFIELCNFAAVALHRYGWSDMADVVKADVDPHAHTSAMMLGVPLEEFLKWKDDETVEEQKVVDGKVVEVKRKDLFDQARQMAKPVNFGLPAGLGVASLVSYAKSTYKVHFTVEEAKERRDKLTKEIYRELDLYLSEDGVALAARNLQAPLWEVRDELGDIHLSSVSKILTGNPKRVDGKPYQRTFVSRVWASLAGLNRNPDLKEALDKRQPSAALAARVCHAGVATLTGRIRGRVRYSQARNTPFQGLAADGAALALFELVKAGFRVVGFVHDEILVELPDEGGFVSAAKVQQVKDIMCRQMEKVLVGGIPANCETALSERWHKKAKLIVRDDKVYPWKPAGG